MPLSFRDAVPADIPVLRDLASRIWRLSYEDMISPEQIEYMLDWMYAERKIAAEMAEGVLWQLAELEGESIGYLSLGISGTNVAELCKLYLLPAHQGCGLGQQMLAHGAALAASHGCGELRLRVNKNNPRALRAYRRAGFAILDSLVADIGGGYVMDDFVLTLPLPQRLAQ